MLTSEGYYRPTGQPIGCIGHDCANCQDRVNVLAEVHRRASKAQTHEHMTDLMAVARLLSKGLTEAEVMQAKLKAED